MPETQITLSEEEAREFELFCACKMINNSQKFEYLKHEKIRDGRLIIHFKTFNNRSTDKK